MAPHIEFTQPYVENGRKRPPCIRSDQPLAGIWWNLVRDVSSSSDPTIPWLDM